MQQPVPAEKLRELYTARLEVIVAQRELQEHVRQVQETEAGYAAQLAALEKEFSFDRNDWSFDLKAGTMTRVSSSARGATRRGKRRRAR